MTGTTKKKTTVIGGATVVALAAVIKQIIPDIRRYLKMRRM
ncbi:hypothetical protein OHS33_02640 [Streptomyces sp. NBC_00536]|nr:hypothetical protein [Streptomyces sp. NBC_00536]WUC77344.1 hypothetical protein OHS33_02640 [Streptomyces sp. NBC_00536]